MHDQLIFDFDGTLANSFEGLIDKFNILANEFNFKKIDSNELIILRTLSSKELIQYLNIPIYKIPSVLYKARKMMSKEILSIPPFMNLIPMLQKLYDSQFTLGILSSNSAENVVQWLNTNNIKHLFNFIHTEASYFGKQYVIKKLIKKYKLNQSNLFYIGDETRDIEAAKKNHIYSVAVTWGFNSEEVLQQYKPDYIAKEPVDLLKIFKL